MSGAYRVWVRGHGRAQIGAYGIADAEHQVEKELARAWLGARITVEEVGRSAGAGRIVETFAVGFRVEGWVAAEGADSEAAERAAFRQVREWLAGSRFRGVELTAVSTDPA